jgi:polar amino acid transport system permease protein
MGGLHTLISVQLPQAIRIVIPPLTNEFVLLLKDTALISVLGMQANQVDLTQFGRNNLNTYVSPTPLIAIAVVYLVISIPLTQLVSWLERRQQRAVAR